LLTNDIQALEAGSSCYAALLTPQGRMITDMHVLETGEFLLIDTGRERVADLARRLDDSIFTEGVTVREASSDYRRAAIIGPDARRVLEQALASDPQKGSAHFMDEAWEVPVFELFIDPTAPELMDALRGAGAIEVGPEAVETLRIESGVPLFGVDMDEDTIPLEAGIEDRAISFTKGCYVGQEVIIRVLHRGHGRVARKLVRLEIAAPEGDLPAPGTIVRASGKDIGNLTSVAWSPRLARGVALGYVHREFVENERTFQTPEGVTVAIRRASAADPP
jgi:folate-binding protein YgfZ